MLKVHKAALAGANFLHDRISCWRLEPTQKAQHREVKKRKGSPDYIVYPLHQNVPELTFSCFKVQRRIPCPLRWVWVQFLFYAARVLSYMASGYHCNFLMHFQMEPNGPHHSFRITIQYWKWTSGLPLASAESLQQHPSLRKQSSWVYQSCIEKGQRWHWVAPVRWERTSFCGQWTLWEGRWNRVLFKQSRNVQKNLGGWIEVCTLIWRQQVQRAGYGGLGRGDTARNGVLQKFQLACTDICHNEGTANSQERI